MQAPAIANVSIPSFFNAKLSLASNTRGNSPMKVTTNLQKAMFMEVLYVANTFPEGQLKPHVNMLATIPIKSRRSALVFSIK